MSKKRLSFPRPGLRIFKSVIAVFLCFVVYLLRGKNGIPFYSALAVLQCMQQYQSSTKTVAKNRCIGTFIGAFWGVIAVLVELQIPVGLLLYACNALFIGLVLYSTVILNNKQSSYFSCIVFLSITINHITDSNPYIFILNRILDTLIGVALGLLVNAAHLPRSPRKDVLFVSGIDDTILGPDNHLSDYSKIELNRLIEGGCQFTVSTNETPASVRELLAGVSLKLPIIAMDGSVLYDMADHRYLLKKGMSKEQADNVMDFLDARNINYFVNSVEDDLLVIFYQHLDNKAEREIFERRRKSPYRNYVCRQERIDEHVIYLFVDAPTEKMKSLYADLQAQTWSADFRFVLDESESFEGYQFLKIYNKDATRENMLEHLKMLQDIQKTVTFGSIPNKYDVYIEDSSRDNMVKQLNKLYQPLWYKKH